MVLNICTHQLSNSPMFVTTFHIDRYSILLLFFDNINERTIIKTQNVKQPLVMEGVDEHVV